MAVIRITDFGGEMPRVLARDLPLGAAQVNANLLATSSDFRPVKQPVQVAAATDLISTVTNAKSLFRRARGANGVIRTSDSDGWYANPLDLSFAKYQLVDDATERTAVSYNDGLQPPRASDIKSEASPYPSRPLGVPRPEQPIATLNVVPEFTLSDANEWCYSVLLPAVQAAFTTYLDESLPNARFYGGVSTAGLTSIPSPYQLPTYVAPDHLSQRGKVEPWNLLIAVPKASAVKAKLDDARLGGVTDATYTWLAINVLPFWGRVNDVSGFTAAIGAIDNPRYTDGTKMWSGAALTAAVGGFMAFFNPEDSEVMALRAQLDQAYLEFTAACYYALTSFDTAPTTPGAEPLLSDAAYNGWVYQAPYRGYEGDSPEYKNSQYIAWETAHKTWETTNSAYAAFAEAANTANAKRVTAMIAAQVKCTEVSQKIEALYRSRVTGLMDKLKTNVEILGLVKSETNPIGIIEVDPDRIVDSRFYAVTWVDDWSQESMPSPVTAMLEVDQNDTVTITMPTLPGGRNITHWRLYRSNVASSGAADFQFVEEIEVTATTTRTIGGASATVLGYTDTKLSSALGEVCTTVDWAEPPVRQPTAGITNTAPYIRGLTGGANGVMACFLDNFVAFCEPYAAYAWPVKYQVPVEFPVVGVCAFGQSWFVGTMGNPYIIYGDSPENYVPQKLDTAQSLVSRRSMIAREGGVFYASPDGYCLASMNGVEVITRDLFSREDWQALDPSSIFGVVHDQVLYFWYSGNGGGCYGLDMVARKLTRHNIQATAVWQDVVTDAVFAAYGGYVYKLFSGARATGVFRSGNNVIPRHTPFSWLQVWGEQSPSDPVVFKWYTGDILVYTATVTSNEPVRLPSGRYREHTLHIESTARVNEVVIASSTEELQSV